MPKENRKYRRSLSNGYLRIKTSLSGVAYTVSVRDASKSGAFIHTIHLPVLGETITFEILDEYGLMMVRGHGKVVRVINDALEPASGFAVHFDGELDQAMFDYLCAMRMEEAI